VQIAKRQIDDVIEEMKDEGAFSPEELANTKIAMEEAADAVIGQTYDANLPVEETYVHDYAEDIKDEVVEGEQTAEVDERIPGIPGAMDDDSEPEEDPEPPVRSLTRAATDHEHQRESQPIEEDDFDDDESVNERIERRSTSATI
jgi:hypothetical protein